VELLPGLGFISPGLVAAKIKKFDSSGYPMLIRYKLTNGEKNE